MKDTQTLLNALAELRRENPVKSVFHCKFTFFTGFSGDFDGEFSLVFHGENAMKIS